MGSKLKQETLKIYLKHVHQAVSAISLYFVDLRRFRTCTAQDHKK